LQIIDIFALSSSDNSQNNFSERGENEHHRIKNLEGDNKKLEGIIQKKDDEIEALKEALILLRAQKFGRQSEKYVNHDQTELFDDIEVDESSENDDDDSDGSETEVKGHQRKNRGKRQPLPDYLPRVQVIHQLSDEELIGPDGEQYEKIGEEVSEQLKIVPARIEDLRHIRFKYAVKGREELGVRTATLPNQPLPKSNVSSGLLAHIVEAKYRNHLPLYRQESIWKSLDITIPRNTMCRWLLNIGEKCQPIVDEIFEQILLEPYIQADETTLTVLSSANQKPENPSHTSYMWLYNNLAGVVYEYQSSRAGIHPKNKLLEYKGYIQTDAYPGYDCLFVDTQGRISVGCWAHARRKFTDVVKSIKKKDGYANAILKLIGKLYKIESTAKEKLLSEGEILALRQEKSVPILNEIKNTLDDILHRAPPKGLLGKAIGYSLDNWKQLNVYTEHGALEIDNNSTERKVRPFAIGRKNWMFMGNDRAAAAAAVLFTLIENAKLHNMKVFEYLQYVFDRISDAKNLKDYEALTPKYAAPFVDKIKK
jgi:transposase